METHLTMMCINTFHVNVNGTINFTEETQTKCNQQIRKDAINWQLHRFPQLGEEFKQKLTMGGRLTHTPY